MSCGDISNRLTIRDAALCSATSVAGAVLVFSILAFAITPWSGSLVVLAVPAAVALALIELIQMFSMAVLDEEMRRLRRGTVVVGSLVGSVPIFALAEFRIYELHERDGMFLLDGSWTVFELRSVFCIVFLVVSASFVVPRIAGGLIRSTVVNLTLAHCGLICAAVTIASLATTVENNERLTSRLQVSVSEAMVPSVARVGGAACDERGGDCSFGYRDPLGDVLEVRLCHGATGLVFHGRRSGECRSNAFYGFPRGEYRLARLSHTSILMLVRNRSTESVRPWSVFLYDLSCRKAVAGLSEVHAFITPPYFWRFIQWSAVVALLLIFLMATFFRKLNSDISPAKMFGRSALVEIGRFFRSKPSVDVMLMLLSIAMLSWLPFVVQKILRLSE